MAQRLTPERFRQASLVGEGPDTLKECAVEALSDPIELRGVMDCKVLCGSSSSKVLVEGTTEVLATAVGTQYLDRLAMLLRNSPRLESLVVVTLLRVEYGQTLAKEFDY